MASFGIGIGAFMEGLQGGMRARQSMDDRSNGRQRQERQDKLDLEDRQRRVAREDEARKWHQQDRSIQEQDRDRRRKIEDEDRQFQREDRTRRQKREGDDQAFTQAGRERAQKSWNEEDETKSLYKGAGEEAERLRNDDVQKGMQPIEAAGPTPDGRGLPAWKVGDQTFTDPKEAEGASERQTKPVMDYYMTKAAPRVVDGLMKQGKVKEAQAFQQWIKDEKVQAGMKSWALGLQSAHRGDAEGFANHMLDAYNNNGYVADGSTAKGNVLRDKDGNVEGIEFIVTDREGKETKEVMRGMDDLYRMGTQFLAPEAVFQHGMQQLESANKARIEIAKERRMQQYQTDRDTNQSLLRQQEEAAKKQGPAAYEAFQKRINAAMGVLMANDASFGRLSDEEKANRALKYLAAQDNAARSAGPQAGNSAGSPSVPVWRPQQMPPQ